MSLLFFSEQDFALSSKDGMKFLGVRCKGLTFLLFFSTQCPTCHDFISVVKKLPFQYKESKFGLYHIKDGHDKIVKASMGTTTEIKYVPYLVLYNDGIPFALYEGPPDTDKIIQFIHSIDTKLKQSDERKVEALKPTSVNNTRVCYLTMKQAYEPTPQEGKQ